MRSAQSGDCFLPPAGARRYEANHRGIEGEHWTQCACVRRSREEQTLVERQSWGLSNDGGLRMVNWESQSLTPPRVQKMDTFIVFYLCVLHSVTCLKTCHLTGCFTICEHTTQRNAEVKSIINKDRQVAPKRMQLGAHLAVTTHNMGRQLVESVKNARWSMRPQEAGDGFESIVEFQVQIKGHNKREYEDKWQGWQNWTE